METPITVIGWQQVPKEKGGFNIRLYGTRKIVLQDGCAGEGEETIREYYNPEFCQYTPAVGDVIILIKNRFGIERVIKVS